MLYVVQLPDPPAGTDFQFVVPGNYLYDVTGITALLTTPNVPGFPNCPDVSGHGNDATYTAGGSTFVPGLVPGNNAIKRNAGNGDQINTTHPIIDVSQAFTYVEWIQLTAPLPNDMELGGYADSVTGHTGWTLTIPSGFPNRFFVSGVHNMAGGATIFETANGTVPYDGAPHMIAVTFDPAANPQNTFYLDGAVLPWNVVDVPFVFNGPSAGWHWNVGDSPDITDEIAILPGALTGGQVAALYAAGGAFAGYNAAVMAAAPFVYYHLDGAGMPGTGRQPSLIVTDGTTELEAIPTGFPAVSTPGPYEYAWQPNLRADTQSTDGTLTTVAIPELLLPAGYTVGVRTLDLQAGDQWSAVTLWWDSDYMNLVGEFSDYAYPPGAYYVYQQTGAPA
jgi:hypothetical protein